MNEENNKDDVTPVMQININRTKGCFEMAKTGLNNDFEQCGLESFLRSYLDSQREGRQFDFEKGFVQFEDE